MNVNTLTRQLLLSIALFAPFAQATTSEPATTNHAVVLLYHHVSEVSPAVTSVKPARFEEQLDYIANNGFQVWPLTKITEYLLNNESLPDKVIAISFDDGYRSIFDTAYPLLKAKNFPFTIFVSTEAIDKRYPSHMRWKELREMQKNGATIANHSVSHLHMLHRKQKETQSQWLQRINREINQAQQRLVAELGIENQLFAYPYGEYNQRLQGIVAELGYIAFGQESGPIGPHSDHTALPRFPVAGNYTDMKDFALKIHTLPLPLSAVSAPDSPLDYSDRTPALTLVFSDQAPALTQLQCFASGGEQLAPKWLEQQPQTAVFQSSKALAPGRGRYNCTAPATDGRFYWYSHPWVILKENGQQVID